MAYGGEGKTAQELATELKKAYEENLPCEPILSEAAFVQTEKAETALEIVTAQLQESGDASGEAFFYYSWARVLLNKGLLDTAVPHAKRARKIYQQLDCSDGEKAVVQILTGIHEEKGLDAPSSIFRNTAMRHLFAVAQTVQDRNGPNFYKAMEELINKADGLFTVSDFKAALDPSLKADKQGTIEFLEENVIAEVVERVLNDLRGFKAKTDGDAAEADKSKDPPCTLYYFKHNQMYSGIRIGEALVYGPRYRLIRGWCPKVGYGVMASPVRPSSVMEDWQSAGWEWNACLIDASVHVGFGGATIYSPEEPHVFA